MPLFGHKNKTSPERNAARNSNNNTTAGPGVGGGPTGTGTGSGYNDNTSGDAYNMQGPNYSQQGPNHNQPGSNNNQPGSNFNQPGYGDRMNQSADPNGNTVGANDSSVPPVNHFSTGSRPSSGGRLTGKIEHAVGALVGSQQLKAKGVQKEQEAAAINQQGDLLAEAERHEKDAVLIRERAVQHGAHPDNRHLGGIANAPQSGNNDMGAGQGTGVGRTGQM